MTDVLVVIGTGGIGLAIARRQGPGKAVLLADVNEATLAAGPAALTATGYWVHTQRVDVSDGASVRALADAAARPGESGAGRSPDADRRAEGRDAGAARARVAAGATAVDRAHPGHHEAAPA